MAHDSFDEDIELANGHPVGSCRNSPNMAERTLLNTAKELEAAESEIRYYRDALKDAVSIIGELMGYDNWLAYPPYLAERAEEFIAPFDAEGI